MQEVTAYAEGTPCWADLATPDPRASRAFYGRVLGWTSVDVPAGDSGVYTMCQVAGKEVAALYELGTEAPRRPPGSPSWTAYISVDDVDATSARVEAAGGEVLAKGFDVLEAGRMAVVADPSGAVVATWQPEEDIGARLVDDPGALCWFELGTPDPAAAAAFYARVFGWEISEQVPGVEYLVCRLGGRGVAGLRRLPLGSAAAWLVCFAVVDADAAAAAAIASGGSAPAPPADTEAGRSAVLRDPAGAAFGILAERAPPR